MSTEPTKPKDDDMDFDGETAANQAADRADAAVAEESPDIAAAAAAPASLEEVLAARLQEAEDRTLRLRAEMDNFRKRSQREIAETRKLAKIGAIEEFMPVHDTFNMAMQAIDTATDMETMKVGMRMINDQFARVFENLGVSRIESLGKPFDHNLHEALSTEPSEEVPVDHVLRELKPGYLLGDRLLRAASVVVSTGPASAAEAE